ncbi:hypothetical protein LTS10_008251 [Elasticomyces elasticus]|nr:hypothetical protein LTS10_008251 [Elasticomyces elasticus]
MADAMLRPSKRKATDNEGDPDAKRFRPNFSDTITVVVGEEKELFTVHTATICQKSEFFTAACKREWQEGKDKTIPLPDVSPRVFTLYVNWAYTGVLDIEIADDPELQRADDSDVSPKAQEVALSKHRHNNIISLYSAADFLLNEALKERAIDTLLHTWKSKFVWPTLISKVWRSTATGSGLRRLILDTIVSHSKGSDYIAQIRGDDSIPADFFIDVAERSLFLHGPLKEAKPTLSRKDQYYDRNSSATSD